eukprot:SAG31_NODE_4777_length_2960_cov_1.962950_2_plen_128_part_00
MVATGIAAEPEAHFLIADDFGIGSTPMVSVVKGVEIASDSAHGSDSVEPTLGAPPTFEDVLLDLALTRHSQSFEREDIRSVEDLRRLSVDDCKELGLNIGERNRLCEWSGKRRKARAAFKVMRTLDS